MMSMILVLTKMGHLVALERPPPRFRCSHYRNVGFSQKDSVAADRQPAREKEIRQQLTRKREIEHIHRRFELFLKQMQVRIDKDEKESAVFFLKRAKELAKDLAELDPDFDAGQKFEALQKGREALEQKANSEDLYQNAEKFAQEGDRRMMEYFLKRAKEYDGENNNNNIF